MLCFENARHTNIHNYTSHFLRFKNTTFCTRVAKGNEIDEKIAIRCHNILDAASLDEHGLTNGFYEEGDTVFPETFELLKTIGVTTVVYCVDFQGTHFDALTFNQMAKHYGVTIIALMLPFPSRHMAEWDDVQWRIFKQRFCQLPLQENCFPIHHIGQGDSANVLYH